MYPFNPYDPWLFKNDSVSANCFAVFVREKNFR